MHKIVPHLEQIRIDPKLLSLQINLTNKCESRCVYCRKYEWPQVSLAIGAIKNILYSIKSEFDSTIALSGGEPFAYKHIDEVIYALNLYKMKYVVFTSLITKKKNTLKMIAKTAEKIQVSLDAVEPKLYSKIRRTKKENLDLVIKNLDNLISWRSNNKEQIKLNIVLSNLNYEHIEDIKDFARGRGLNYRIFGVNTWDEFKVKEKDDDKLSPICIIYKIHAVIDADGSVYPCCRLMNDNGEYDPLKRFSYGNIYEHRFIDLFNEIKKSKKYLFVNKNGELCKECRRYQKINTEYFNYISHYKKIFL